MRAPNAVMLLLCVMWAVLSSPTAVAQQTSIPITCADINATPERFVGKTVKLTGVVRNPQEAERGTGTYQLRDDSEAFVTVRTSDLPAGGIEATVEGEVRIDAATNTPYIYEMKRGSPGALGGGMLFWALIAGAALVLVLAIVLAALLLRKPQPAAPEVPAGVPPPPPLPVSGMPPTAAASAEDRTATAVAPGAPAVPPAPVAAAATQEFLGGALAVLQGPDTGTRHVVVDERTTIGRGADRTLRLADPTVSREHATIIVKSDGTFTLTNESQQGTVVNGRGVDSCNLQDGDEIELGSTRIRFECAGSGAGGASAPAAASAETVEVAIPAAQQAVAEDRDKTTAFLGAELQITEGPQAGDSFPLHKPVTSVGRAEDRDIVLASDDSVARENFQIRHESGTFTIVNEPGKTTRLNGNDVAVSQELNDGDEIQVGYTKIVFRKV